MSTHVQRNWFEQGGQAYARFRPEYPAQLAQALAQLTPAHQLAVDVGCGNGQFTQLLPAHFQHVVGLDPSADQIAHSAAHARISYQCAAAESTPLQDASVNLITAAQAAHWFDLPAFYQEVRRIAAPGCVLALISYGVLQLEPALDARFQQFYWEEIGPYWPAERKLVDSGYATLDFPFTELTAPEVDIQAQWDLPQLLGYISTWSAVRRAQEAGGEKLLQDFAEDMAALWGDTSQRRAMRWPIKMRVGVVKE